MDDFKDFNIILINLDGLRQDRIVYCPTLSSLCDSSYYFSEMKTVAPYTFASLHAIFSGMYPSKNGVNAYYNILKFNKDFTTLAQLVKECGYYTSCDVISSSVMPKQGIDDWNVFDEETVDFKQRHTDLIRSLSNKNKFFLFLHYTETHKNLVREIVQKYKNEDNDDNYFNSKDENEKRYNSHLPACDEYVKSIIDILSECNLTEKTILIFFSDHGTSVGEKRGEKFYGVFVYDYTLNVFCILHIPKTIPKIINQQCRTIDIFPTLAEIVGKPSTMSKIQGESLFSLLNDSNAPDREVFVETGGLYGPWPSPRKHNVFCIRTKMNKLIYNDTPETWEFYNFDTDPNEMNNCYDENSPSIIQMKKRLLHYFTINNIENNFTAKF